MQSLNEITIVKPEATDTLKTRPTLLSKVRRGDEDGWNKFYELYRGFIYSAARAAGLSHEESRDVVQDTMITVQNYVGGFRPDENRARFRTWLRKVVHSRIADQYRRKKRNPLENRAEQPSPVSEETATSTTDRIPDLNEIELARIIDGKLEETIITEARRLTKENVRMEHYQAYDLFAIQGLSAADVAISLGIKSVTVRVWAFRVRRVVDAHMRRIVRSIGRPKGNAVS